MKQPKTNAKIIETFKTVLREIVRIHSPGFKPWAMAIFLHRVYFTVNNCDLPCHVINAILYYLSHKALRIYYALVGMSSFDGVPFVLIYIEKPFLPPPTPKWNKPPISCLPGEFFRDQITLVDIII